MARPIFLYERKQVKLINFELLYTSENGESNFLLLVERKQAGESQPGKEALCVECGEEDGGLIVAKEEDDGVGEVVHASICELD
jgi:hypothetical protein